MSYISIDESANLAKKEGNYKNFYWFWLVKRSCTNRHFGKIGKRKRCRTPKSKGIKTWRTNWDILRKKSKKEDEMQQLWLLLLMQTFGLVAGTTQE